MSSLRLSARPTSHSRILPGELLRKTALEVKVFFLDARFEVFSLTVNFAIPFLLLVAEGVTAMNSHTPLDAQKIAVRAATLMTYVSITTALNLIVNLLISLRENGYLLVHAHVMSSVTPLVLSIFISQTLISMAESLLFATTIMVFVQQFLGKLLLSTLVCIPLSTITLGLLFLPLSCWKATSNNTGAVVTVLLIVLFSLPSTSKTSALAFLLALNPVQFSMNIQYLVLSSVSTPQLIALPCVLLCAVLAGTFALSRISLHPLVRRN